MDVFGEERPFDTAPLDPSVLPVDVERAVFEDEDSDVVSDARPAEELESASEDMITEPDETVFGASVDERDEVFAFGGDDPFALEPEGPVVTPTMVVVE